MRQILKIVSDNLVVLSIALFGHKLSQPNQTQVIHEFCCVLGNIVKIDNKYTTFDIHLCWVEFRCNANLTNIEDPVPADQSI